MLGDRRVGVVAGDRGLEGAVRVVGARPQAEVGAPVRGVEADGAALGEDLGQSGHRALGRPGVVLLAPVVEPAVPELRAHERLPVAARAQQPGGLGGARAEGGRRQHAGEGAAVLHQLGRTVGGVAQFGDAPRGQGVVHPPEVGVVVAVAAVLVLDLDGDDGSAVGGLETGDPGHEDVEPAGDLVEVGGVRGTQAHAGPVGEPGGQAAVVPLGADVGAGAHDYVESGVRGEGRETLDVPPAVEAGLARPALVEVPGDVGVHRVQAHRRETRQAVGPLARVHPEVVERTGQDSVRPSGAQQTAVRAGQQGGHGPSSWLRGLVGARVGRAPPAPVAGTMAQNVIDANLSLLAVRTRPVSSGALTRERTPWRRRRVRGLPDGRPV